MTKVTQLLDLAREGDPVAAQELLPLIYEELRRLARIRMAKLPPGQTLQPTALVHEAWIRLSGPRGESKPWSDRWHFFAAAAESMRQILVDQARRKARVKHGGSQKRVDMDDVELVSPDADEKVLQIHEALGRLEEEDEAKAAVVKLKFFGGLKSEEIAGLMGVSEKTVRRYWSYAKTWLYKDIRTECQTSSNAED